MLFEIYKILSFVGELLPSNIESERGFQDTKIYRKCKFQGVWDELEIKMK